MLRFDPPSSDAPLLAGLSAAVSVMIGFGLLMYWLMQPTVLPSAPFDMAEQRTPVVLRVTPQTLPPDVEQAAIAMAAQENEIQGLRPALAANTASEPAPTQAQAQATPPKAARPKRAVAKAPRRDAERAYATNWWGGGHSPFGGFGSWYR